MILLASLASAADLSDVFVSALRGPPGCVELTGEVTTTLGETELRARLEGRLEDGSWQAIEVEALQSNPAFVVFSVVNGQEVPINMPVLGMRTADDTPVGPALRTVQDGELIVVGEELATTFDGMPARRLLEEIRVQSGRSEALVSLEGIAIGDTARTLEVSLVGAVASTAQGGNGRRSWPLKLLEQDVILSWDEHGLPTREEHRTVYGRKKHRWTTVQVIDYEPRRCP